MIRLFAVALVLWGAAMGVRAQLPVIDAWDEVSCEDVLSTWPSGTDFPPGLSASECYSDGDGGLYVWVTDWVVEPARSLFKYLSRPQACVVCEILYGIMDFLKPLGNAAFTLLVDPVLMLLGVGFAVALAFGAGRILLAGTEAGSLEPWRHLAISKVRFVVALVLLGGVGAMGGSGGASGPACEGAEVVPGDEQARAVFSELYDCVLSPAMGTSVGLGMVLLDAVSLQSRVGASETSLLTHASSEADKFLEMVRGVGSGEPPVVMKGVMTLASGLNQVGRLGMAQGLGYISDSRMVAGGGERWVALLGGLILVLLFAVFLITSGLALLDPLLRMVIVFALSPLMVAAWVFGPFRQMAETGLRVLLYVCVYFVLAGLVYGVAFGLVVHSMRGAYQLSPPTVTEISATCAGWSPSSSGLPPDGRCACLPVHTERYEDLLGCVLSNGGALSFEGGTPSIDVGKIFVSLVSLLLAQSVILMLTPLAGGLSRYAVTENLARQPEAQMRGLATSAVTTSAYVGMAAAGQGMRLAKGVRQGVTRLGGGSAT